MSKVSNALLMLQYLENGRKYSIKELAQELEVSERMIRSYKDDLEKAGIYIDTIMGPYGGYVLNQSIRIPSRKFSIDDYMLYFPKINSIKAGNLKAMDAFGNLTAAGWASQQVGINLVKGSVFSNLDIIKTGKVLCGSSN